MKKNIVLFILFITSFSFAQTIRFEGIVSEGGNTPLDMANIMAVNATTKAMDAYAITNNKGKFSLNLKKNTSYVIKLTYIGMQNKEINVTTKEENIVQNISMNSGGIELNDVEIVREMPVSIKGDTIVYNADSFKSGTEKKLEDVLKKLPGVEVNADGEVEVEGKKVTKLMVEGKDFFDGDTKLGVKNIPSDAIDKIQVLRNFNEVSQLKGLENNEENVAMNIKLKSGKKNFWFGDMTAGGGTGNNSGNTKLDRYIVNPKAFYYNPKYSVNIISNFNNIGELPLTIQDYFKMTGGFRGMMKKGGSAFNVASNDLGIMGLRNNRAKEIETKFGATNFSYNPTKSWTISGFGVFSSSKTQIETNSQSKIIASQTQIASKETPVQQTNYGLAKISSSYKPNTNFQFDYDVLLKKSNQEENSFINRETTVNSITASEYISTYKKQNPTSANQNFSIYYTLKEKSVFDLEIQHLFQEEDPFYNANLRFQPFTSIIGYIPNQNRNDISQNRFVKTNKVDSKLDYYYMVTPKSNINVTLGNTYSYQNFNSAIFQILDSGIKNDLNYNTNSNQVTYNFNDAFIGLHYKMLLGKITITPGFSQHIYSMKNQQLGSDSNRNFSKFLPDLYVLYQLKKAETLTYNYSLTNVFTDISQLAQGFILNGYSSLFKGNRDLENATSQIHSLRYFKYNMFNFENIFANASYTRTTDAVKTSATFSGANQTSSPYNSNFPNESASAMGSYGRSFLKNYKASGSANVNWSKFSNIQNGSQIETISESFTQNYSIKTSTMFKNLPNIEVGYTTTINDYNHARYYTNTPSITLDYYFLDGFAFVTDYSYNHYFNSDKTIDNQYQFLNASLNYQKKDSKFEYKISATNLLNTTSLNDNNFNQFTISSSQYIVQPRYIMFSMKYNL
ncbi:carboxypeptidase-like regulatory domain-containing protein [Flavobacterium sp.]|uniref:carboxypeptidase-like regulatory domain-containing protein n=1 Tax=Flavobacterium sp. TaxID=239 RepID=UPI0038D06C61